MTGSAAHSEPSPPGFKRGLSLFDSSTIVAGSMIGSGIFIVSADIVRQVHSPFMLLLVWLVSGAMTIAGALAYGELAGMMPEAGGQYVYLREAYGGVWAFMFGWTLLLVIQTGTIAAVAVAFARFAGVIWPVFGSELWFGANGMGLSGERVGAIAVIAVLTWANLRGLEVGKYLQNIFTTAKILSLLLIVAVGLIFAPNLAAIHANFGGARAFFGGGTGSIEFAGVFGGAMVGALFSADAWANITFVAAEVRNPKRDVARALALGAGGVILLYVLTNIAYLCELPAAGTAGAPQVFARGIAHATSDRVASAAMEIVWHRAGGVIAAILVMVSTFGCANGMILAGARVLYAMARDRVFFASAGRLNGANVPGAALAIQGAWAALLTLSGTYLQLLDYVIFAQLLFYVLTVAAVFVMRRTRPAAPRPYRAWGYPIVPALYIAAASALMIDLLILRPRFTWPGLIIALSGAPVYFWTRRRAAR
ncbi:MAG: APC family permease [Candidatus Binataceae bacterium]